MKLMIAIGACKHYWTWKPLDNNLAALGRALAGDHRFASALNPLKLDAPGK
jgi:hypothetical protein